MKIFTRLLAAFVLLVAILGAFLLVAPARASQALVEPTQGFLPGQTPAVEAPADLPMPAPAPAAQSNAGTSASVTVAGSIHSVRVLVVDTSGRIVQVWSNARTEEGAALLAALGDLHGPAVALSSGVMSQYEQLKGKIDWSRMGRVY